ncbi:hypothetical protein ncot_15900 [Nocardioides sp. JQ2195]|uniref:hypothetical protein n=1 Tax=Nocardioides sp. JQ2195 TaxID=2592334 RepID=UPI00143E609B|nr:hypothetical protein [Nocardioides sp. JQ2195]QIX27903.1 hypothetical protein ncot_15900 [Nocardioides sp. JQ2195]
MPSRLDTGQGLGVPLAKRHGFTLAVLAVGLFLLVPAIRTVVGAREPMELAMAAALVLLELIIFGAAWFLWRQRVWVSAGAVLLTRGGKVRRTVDLARLEHVDAGIDHGTGVLGNHPRVIVWTLREDGRRLGIPVSGRLYADLSPLVAALAPHVASRPELLRTEENRDGWARLTAASH